MNNSEEVRRNIDMLKEEREKNFPIKVAIFPGRYQQKKEEYLISLADKDAIGRCLSEGLTYMEELAVEKGVDSVISINDDVRIAAGMAIIDCKDVVCAKWVMNAVKGFPHLPGNGLREGIDLKATMAEDSNPFKAYTVSTIGFSGVEVSWELALTILILQRKNVKTEGWIRLNTRKAEKSVTFTMIDTERELHKTFIAGSRLKIVITLIGSVAIRMTAGENEKGMFITKPHSADKLSDFTHFQTATHLDKLSSRPELEHSIGTLVWISSERKLRTNQETTSQKTAPWTARTKDEKRCKGIPHLLEYLIITHDPDVDIKNTKLS